MDAKTMRGKAVVTRDKEVLEEVEMPVGVPHNFMIAVDFDGNDVWLGTGKGLAWGIGDDYYPGVRPRTARTVKAQPESKPPVKKAPAPTSAGLLKQGGE
jgi:hypothetical protein